MSEQTNKSTAMIFGGCTEIPLNVGQNRLVVEQTAAGDTIALYCCASHRRVVEIALTAAGPVLRLGGDFAVDIEGKLAIAADTIGLRAKQSFDLVSDGTLNIDVAGEMTASAESHRLTAELGDVTVEANDDVIARGERIRMNC